MKKLLLLTTLLISAQTFAMELPPQAPMQPLVPMPGLPADVQRCLFPFVITGKPTEIADSIIALAQIDKAFKAAMNNETAMLHVLNMFPEIAAKVTLYEKFKAKARILPVMRSPAIQEWYAYMEGSIEYGDYIRERIHLQNEKRKFVEKLIINATAASLWAMMAGVLLKGDKVVAALRK